MKNATSMMLFGISYLVIFGFLIGITGLGAINFSFSEIGFIGIISVGLAIAVAALVAGLVGTTILGTGSPEAGRYAWNAALFVIVASWATYFVTKMTGLMPSGTPGFVSILFLGPPTAALLWGMFATFLKSGAEG